MILAKLFFVFCALAVAGATHNVIAQAAVIALVLLFWWPASHSADLR